MSNETVKIGERTPLGRIESTWVSDWLKSKGSVVRSGWYGVYKMTPYEIAKKYKVQVDDVVSAANGEQR